MVIVGKVADSLVEAGRQSLELVGRAQGFELIHRFFGGVFNHHQGQALVKAQGHQPFIIKRLEEGRAEHPEVFENMAQDALVLHGRQNRTGASPLQNFLNFHPPAFDGDHA